MSTESVPPLAEIMHDLEGTLDQAPEVTCTACGALTPAVHYLINGQRTCETCASQVPADESTRLGRFSRALIFGTVAAVLCAGLWYGVMTITGYELGLIALIVGLVVGVAVRLGSNERGGWVYQGMAVTLTYLAIVTTYVPIVVEALDEGIAEDSAPPAEVVADEAGKVPPPTPIEAPTTPGTETPRALIYAVAIPLAAMSPVLMMLDDFAASLMWLIIIGVALFEAWKVNQGNGAPTVEGPFEPPPLEV